MVEGTLFMWSGGNENARHKPAMLDRMVTVVRKLPAALVMSIAMSASQSPAGDNAVSNAIEAKVTDIARGSLQSIGGIPLSGASFIVDLYGARSYEPAWVGDDADQELQVELTDALREGFTAADFHADLIAKLRGRAISGDPEALADLDIAETEVAARLLHHIYYGKVDPTTLDAAWNFDRAFAPGKAAEMVNQYLNVAGIGALVDDIGLRHPAYLLMQDALAKYRQIESDGGWPEIPIGDVLKPEAQDERVSVLRRRLAITGDFFSDSVDEDTDTYDEKLVYAVKHFQTRHGLEADGVIGPRTFLALNRPVSFRIDQLRSSLERARWTLRDVDSDYVLVNIAGAETLLFQDGSLKWKTRSIVGQEYRKTPVFRDVLSYMEFNPTWTVPASIFRKDKLARIRNDPAYLSRGGYTVRGADGKTLDPASVDWWSENPGVTLVQQPGPKNALGRVKFMFPNQYAVYLHDTDDRSLFDRSERNLSSGCVRVENPFQLADLLMRDAPDWNSERREAILNSGKTTRIDLLKPIPILITYYTAWATPSGEVEFREDIYDRDPALLKALNADFSG